MKRLILLLLKFYQLTISPFIVAVIGHGCRFQPTCSEYSRQAILAHGVIKGGKLSIKRISKCHPLYRGDQFDPLPKKA